MARCRFRRTWGCGRQLAPMFKEHGDETRLEMLALLVQRDELCVCRFEEALGITQSKASRHLRYLLNAGLVTDRRDAVWVHYLSLIHISEPTRLLSISYAVFCLKKKKRTK